ncbi:MAG: flagellar protein FlaG [Desulfobulbus sp.]|jgi:flagellar protein FlaG
MFVEAINAASPGPPQASEPARQIQRQREEERQEPSSSAQEKKMQPEELLQQVKALSQDGMYGIRFERDNKTEALIVKLVDKKTDEVIRQIPPEELLTLSKRLKERSGNVVDTVR